MLFVNFLDVFHNLAISLLFPCVIAVRSRHGLSMASQPPGRRARIDVAGARTQKPAASVTAGVFKISISAGPRTGPILGDALRSMQAFRHHADNDRFHRSRPGTQGAGQKTDDAANDNARGVRHSVS